MKSKNVEKSKGRIIRDFVIILVVSMVVGFFMGFISGFTEELGGKDKAIEALKVIINNSIPVCLIITAFLGIVIPIISYMKCKVMYNELHEDMDNDELLDTIEEKLNVPLLETNIATIVNMCLFFCCIHSSFSNGYISGNKQHLVIVIVAAVLAIISFIVSTIIQNAVVEMEKKLNPEKKGTVFDTNFHKVWLDSCDEAQKLMVYKAGYKAFTVTSISCSIIFVVGFLIIEFFKLDIFALVLVAIIMGINNVSYMIEGAKLERRK